MSRSDLTIFLGNRRRADGIDTDHIGIDQIDTKQMGTIQIGTIQIGTDQSGTHQSGTNRSGTNQSAANQSDANHSDAEPGAADQGPTRGVAHSAFDQTRIHVPHPVIARVSNPLHRARNLSTAAILILGLMTLHAPPSAAADTTKPARAGASIYGVSCASCHSYGMRGAPKLTDRAAWAPRLAQPPGTLYTHVIKGLGWMPPRGTCSTCTDQEIKAAVDYMVSRLPKP